jgi:hypothetical protein
MIGLHHCAIMIDSEVVDTFIYHPFLIDVTDSGVFERSKRPAKFSGGVLLISMRISTRGYGC